MEDMGCCISIVRFSILVEGGPDWFSFSVVLVGFVNSCRLRLGDPCRLPLLVFSCYSHSWNFNFHI